MHKIRSSKKRKKPKTKFQLQVERLDRYFSKYIRLSAMDENGYCVCVSCGDQKPWNKGIHAGHFISKNPKTYRTRWSKRNTHPQCVTCNSYNEGNKFNYGKYLIKKYGPDICIYLQIKSTKHFNPLIFDMEKKIEYYKSEVKSIILNMSFRPIVF